MKKVLNRIGLRPVLAGLFFVAAFVLGATRAEAQVSMTNTQVNTAKGLNWVTESEAIAILNSNVDQIAINLGNLIPGSQAYNNAVYHLSYYKWVSQEIQHGTVVPQAVIRGLGAYGPSGPTDAASNPPAVSNTLYNDIVSLLTF